MGLGKSALVAAITTTLGVAAVPAPASAAVITADWNGLFTLLDTNGAPTTNTSYPYYGDPAWGYGLRTQINGTLSFDTATGSGNATVNPFEFFAAGPAVAHDIQLQAIADGAGGAGTLVAGSLLFDWNTGGNSIAIGIVLDAAGFFASGPAYATGQSIAGTGALPASDGMSKGKFPIGPVPLASSTLDTNFHNDRACVLSAACITGDDGIGGSPMDNGPFLGFSANFDIVDITITAVTPAAVPVPAAVWLCGSGLLGLVGVARRRRQR